MSDWTSDLHDLDVTVRPLSRPVELAHRYAPFKAAFRTTVRELAREFRALDAERVVLEIDVRERDIRADGMPRADAKPSSSAVAVSFESRHGPLRYATGEYVNWQHNLRAIALSMEALRAVDRHGVSKRGEQYQGWRELLSSNDAADSLNNVDEAREWLRAEFAEPGETIDLPALVKRATYQTHPDHGGDADKFRRVRKAKELLRV